jgi:hypothetical protein
MPSNSETKQWADALDRLLQRAATVRTAENTAEIVAVQKALREFIRESPDYADALDTQATLAIFDLDLLATEDAVAKIKERAAEVYRLTKLITGVAAEANAQAGILNGTLATKAIEAATSAIASFKQLRDGLSSTNAAEKSIAAEIDKGLAAVQTLRNKLENP